MPGCRPGCRVAVALQLMLVLTRSPQITASEGDRDGAFQWCVDSCQVDGCIKLPLQLDDGPHACDAACPHTLNAPVPASLRWTGWSCADDCKYRCMMRREAKKDEMAGGGDTVKYYGKWPFVRVAGLQEPASVLLSLANLAAHAHNLVILLGVLRSLPQVPSKRQGRRRAAYPYTPLWVAYSVISASAWAMSAVFHARDTRLTERLDYLAADAVVLYSLFLTLARVSEASRPRQWLLWGAPVLTAYLWLAHHMLFVLFDYGLNVQVCVVAGMVQAVLWVGWAACARHPARRQLYAFVGLINAALLLEVLDFPPILGVLDAHAAWHAVTVPLMYRWYAFVAADARWTANRQAAAAAAQA